MKFISLLLIVGYLIGFTGEYSSDKINIFPFHLNSDLQNNGIIYLYVEKVRNLLDDNLIWEVSRRSQYKDYTYMILTQSEYSLWLFALYDTNQWKLYFLGRNLLPTIEIDFGDVDGDNQEEIFLHIPVDASGTMGPFYNNYLLKIEETTLVALYDSTKFEKQIDLGFQFAFLYLVNHTLSVW